MDSNTNYISKFHFSHDQSTKSFTKSRDTAENYCNKQVYLEKNKIKIYKIDKWLKSNQNRDLIKHRFFCFLFGTNDEKFGTNFYIAKIKNLFFYHKKSLLISFLHLVIGDPLLAIWLIDEPVTMLSIFQESCRELTQDVFTEFSKLDRSIFVRIAELPVIDSIKKCRSKKINQLIKVNGIVISKTEVYSSSNLYKLICLKCFQIQKNVYTSKENRKALFAVCFNCKGQGPFQISWTQTNDTRFQKIFIQEIVNLNAPEGIPCKREVILKNDLIDYVKLGEEILVTGILQHNYSQTNHFVSSEYLFNTHIEANLIEKTKIFDNDHLFNSSEETILKNIFRKKQILKLLCSAFLPSLIKSESVQLSLLLSIFSSDTRKRRNFLAKKGLNVLIIGDPSTGKTQLLKGIEKLTSKSIFLTGQNCTTKGLTATLRYEKNTDDWIMEGGALVVADRGFCLIDEVEKLRIQDKIFLTEAIEQQTITLKKKGVIMNLKTRCTIIATSSPNKDYYRSHDSFSDNFPGEISFVEKFDLLIPLRDVVDTNKDFDNAKFVVESHQTNLMRESEEKMYITKNRNRWCNGRQFSFLFSSEFSQRLFKKYILYARSCIHPALTQVEQEFITNFYIVLKNEHYSTDSIKPCFRHLEAMIRIVESSARIHLRNFVVREDLFIGLSTFLFSFLETQPNNIRKNLSDKFGSFLNSEKTIFQKLIVMIENSLVHSKTVKNDYSKLKKQIFERNFRTLCKDRNILENFYKSKIFTERGFFFDKTGNFICKI